MKLTVLVDNNTLIDRYFWGEPAVSYFIETEDKKILLDTGYSNIFIQNAQKMGIDLRTLDFVILSHGHLDHTWGLQSLFGLYTEAILENIPHTKPRLITHPLAFLTKTVGDLPEIGSVISKEKVSRHFKLTLSRAPVWITEQMVFLGEIEKTHDFESEKPMSVVIKNDSETPDYLIDDTALAYKTPRGLVIITGCSHAGICNIVDYAKKVCKDERVVDIIGGLHLLNPTQKKLNRTLEYLKTLQSKIMHPCHCTDLKSKIALSKVTNIEEVGVGLKLSY